MDGGQVAGWGNGQIDCWVDDWMGECATWTSGQNDRTKDALVDRW